MSILIRHGPNLNLLGVWELQVHRSKTPTQIDAELARIAADAGAKLQSFQSNPEGALIDRTMASI